MSTLQKEAKSLMLERPDLARAVATLWNERHGMAPKTNLTPRQRDVFTFLQDYARDHDGSSPTYREIQKAIGLASVSGVVFIIAGLEERGFIIRNEGRSRSIRII